jgi:hypothetical protein
MGQTILIVNLHIHAELRSMKTGGEQVSLKILAAKFQPQKEELPRMAPPKVGAPGQTTRKHAAATGHRRNPQRKNKFLHRQRESSMSTQFLHHRLNQ